MYYKGDISRGNLYHDIKYEISKYPVVYGLILSFVIVQVLTYLLPQSIYFLGLIPRRFLWGEYWTILTHIFVHFPYIIPFHLLFNAIALYYIGRYTEVLLGPKLMIASFLITGLLGGLLTIVMAFTLPLFNPLSIYLKDAVSVGASGAIFGLFAILAADRPDAEILFFLFIPLLPIIIPIRARAKTLLILFTSVELIFGLLSLPFDYYNHWSHLGGIIGGYLLYKYYLWKRIYQRVYGVQFYER